METEAAVSIRPLSREYAEGVENLENATSSPPWSLESLFRSFSREGGRERSLFLVAVSGGRVCGFIGARMVLDEGEILKLAVAPENRRQGLGQMLLDRALSEMREAGVSRVSLEVRASNRAAIGLYEKNGFRQGHIRKSYYKSPPEDAIILFRKIPRD